MKKGRGLYNEIQGEGEMKTKKGRYKLKKGRWQYTEIFNIKRAKER